jgi:hypothetical protein
MLDWNCAVVAMGSPGLTCIFSRAKAVRTCCFRSPMYWSAVPGWGNSLSTTDMKIWREVADKAMW